ncbi:MAG: ankyrin repeat domain-containing protein [Alphaproteobacteria bacterium]|nr:ankyrin repeat domain-containing protein [Alphaproteobacteria bacterium]
MKRTLVIANMIFASATVWGMDSNVSEDRKSVRQDRMMQLCGQPQDDVLESVAEMFQKAEKSAMEVAKLRAARKKIKEVMNQDQETRKRFFRGIQYGLNLKEMTIDDIKNSSSEKIRSELSKRGYEIPVDFVKTLTPETIQGIFSDIDVLVSAIIKYSKVIDSDNILKFLFSGKNRTPLTNAEIKGLKVSAFKNFSDMIECCMQEHPLHYAYEKGYKDVVKSLIDLGMKVDQPDAGVEGGETLLCKAIKKGDIAMVKYLVSHGADVNREHLGSYPVFQAFYSMQADIVKYLVENGVNPNLRDSRGFTVLQAAQEDLGKIDLCLSQLDEGDKNNFCEDLNYEMKEHNLDVYDAKSTFDLYRSFVGNTIQYLKDHGATE